MPTERQQVLILYLDTSSLASRVVGWSSFDGASDVPGEAGDAPQPPYATGLDALRDGWRLFQASQLMPPVRGQEYGTSFQKFEFFFEKVVTCPEPAAVPMPVPQDAGAR